MSRTKTSADSVYMLLTGNATWPRAPVMMKNNGHDHYYMYSIMVGGNRGTYGFSSDSMSMSADATWVGSHGDDR